MEQHEGSPRMVDCLGASPAGLLREVQRSGRPREEVRGRRQWRAVQGPIRYGGAVGDGASAAARRRSLQEEGGPRSRDPRGGSPADRELVRKPRLLRRAPGALGGRGG